MHADAERLIFSIKLFFAAVYGATIDNNLFRFAIKLAN